MKTSIKLTLNPYKNKYGDSSITIRLTKERKTLYLPTGKHCNREEWNGTQCNNKHPHKERMNQLLRKKIFEITELLLVWETENPDISVNEIMHRIREGDERDLINYFVKYMETFNNKLQRGTYNNYRASMKVLKEYKNAINFKDVDYNFLRDYYNFLINSPNKSGKNTIKQGRTHNTAQKHIKMLKTVLYASGKMDRNKNPFAQYHITWTPTKKSALTKEELHLLKKQQLIGILNDARNIFLFQFYCQGMRISDALKIKKTDINGNIMNYKMKKTGTLRVIELIPEAIEIIKSYLNSNSTDEYIFPFLKNCNAMDTATALVNKSLILVAKMCEITKHITTHVARHTWANLADKHSINHRIIQQALGHHSLSTTETYLQGMNNEAINTANKELMAGISI